jgi:hypothetical protein
MEWSSALSASAAITTITVRSGTAALNVSGSSTSTMGGAHQFLAAATAGHYYMRAYVNFATAPARETGVMAFQGSVGAADRVTLTVDTARALRLRIGAVAGTLVGSATAAVAANTWHCLEIHADMTQAAGACVIEARLNGAVFATTSTATGTAIAVAAFGRTGNGGFSEATGVWYMDDIAINDISGTAQNSWPGEGKIVHLRPAAAGSSNTWEKIAGTAGDTSNFNQVSEVPPDDATTYLKRITTTIKVDDYTVSDPVAAGISGNVNVVQIGVRGSGSSSIASTALDILLRLKSSSGGTVSKSAASTNRLNSNAITLFVTHTAVTPQNYQLTSYTDPTTAAAWTVTGTNSLTNMQIGMENQISSTSEVRVSNVWALVEYAPATIPTLTGIASLTGITSITC